MLIQVHKIITEIFNEEKFPAIRHSAKESVDHETCPSWKTPSPWLSINTDDSITKVTINTFHIKKDAETLICLGQLAQRLSAMPNVWVLVK